MAELQNNNRDILIIITSGKEDGGRKATIAFCLAISSILSGIKTSIFLTGNGTYWCDKKQSGTVKIEGFEPLADYIDNFLENDGKLMVCTPCLAFYCGIDGGIKEYKERGTLYSKAEFVGFTTVADMASKCSVINF